MSSTASSILGANNAFQSTLGSGLTALGNYYAKSTIPTTTPSSTSRNGIPYAQTY